MFEIGIFIVGIVAGVLSGMFGIGGGIVMVPALVTLFGLGLLEANAASLAAMLLPVGVLGVINYYKAGYINLRDSLWIAVGLFAGSFAGAEVAVSLDIALLSKLYAAFLLYAALSYLNIPALIRTKRPKAASVQPASIIGVRPLWQLLVLGAGAGIVAGMFGKGGGLVIVPLLVSLFRYDPKAASATSLAALQLPVGLPSVIVYANNGQLNLLYGVLMAAGIVAGVFFGSRLALNLSGKYFKRIYAAFLVVVAAYMVWKYL